MTRSIISWSNSPKEIQNALQGKELKSMKNKNKNKFTQFLIWAATLNTWVSYERIAPSSTCTFLLDATIPIDSEAM